MLPQSFSTPARIRALPLRITVVLLLAAACTSPTAGDACTLLPFGEGIRLTVVSAATGESLAAQAVVHVLSVDPPREEVVGRLDAIDYQNPMRAADTPGVYELLVEVPGYADGFARVTIPLENGGEKGSCGKITRQDVTIRMTLK